MIQSEGRRLRTGANKRATENQQKLVKRNWVKGGKHGMHSIDDEKCRYFFLSLSLLFHLEVYINGLLNRQIKFCVPKSVLYNQSNLSSDSFISRNWSTCYAFECVFPFHSWINGNWKGKKKKKKIGCFPLQ